MTDTTLTVTASDDTGVRLEGWLKSELEAGRTPRFAPPSASLPTTRSIELQVSGGFMAAADDTMPGRRI